MISDRLYTVPHCILYILHRTAHNNSLPGRSTDGLPSALVLLHIPGSRVAERLADSVDVCAEAGVEFEPKLAPRAVLLAVLGPVAFWHVLLEVGGLGEPRLRDLRARQRRRSSCAVPASRWRAGRTPARPRCASRSRPCRAARRETVGLGPTAARPTLQRSVKHAQMQNARRA